MLVELFGMPGAGKTTVAKAVAWEVQATTRKKLSLAWAENAHSKRLFHIIRSLCSPSHLAVAIRFAVDARIAGQESVLRLGRLLAKRDWLKSQRGLVLLDQGFLQDLSSILVSGKAECADLVILSQLISRLYEGMDATIVVIEVGPQLATERIGGRSSGHSRFDKLAESELRQSIDSLVDIHRRIVQAAKLAGLPVYMLDGSTQLEGKAHELLSILPVQAERRGPAERPALPRRISIIGSTGSGKTRLARLLAEQLQLPVFELDKLRAETNSFEDAVEAVTSGEDWVVDGHYRDVRHLIWSRADLVIWLNYPLHLVGAQLILRFARKHTRGAPAPEAAGDKAIREISPKGTQSASWPKRISRFARTLRERREYGRILQSLEYRELRVVELKSRRMTQLWLQSL